MPPAASAETVRPHLADLLAPERIAIVGASRNPRSLAGRYLDHLLKHEYPGAIVPVNRSADEVRGLPAVPSLDAIEDPVDLALITVPGKAAAEAALTAARLEIPLAVMFTSGFAEVGEEGRARQAELTEAFRASSSRLLGPNCPGFVNGTARIGASVSAFVGGHEIPAGGVGIAAQSGAVGGLIAERVLDRGGGLSQLVFTGNEADVEVGEAVEAIACQDETRVVAVFMEGLVDPERTLSGIARAVDGGTPVLVLSVGRSDAGRKAASLHTGKLVAMGQAERAALRQAGAILVDELADLAEASVALATGPRRTGGRRVGIVSTTGGLGAIVADRVRLDGFELPPATDGVRGSLSEVLPPYASKENPCDLADALTTHDDLLQYAVDAFDRSDAYDALVLTMGVHPDWLARALAEDVVEAAERTARPLAMLWPGGAMGDEGAAICRAGGVPILESARALGAMLAGWEVLARERDHERDLPAAPLPRADGAGERELKQALAAGGVAAPAARVVDSSGAAAAAADELGGVLVMKAHDPGLDHKASLGLVRRGIVGADAARVAWEDFQRSAVAADLALDAVLVEEQEHALGLELLISCRRTPLGLELLVGPGGSTAELAGERAMRLAPVAGDAIAGIAAELGVKPELNGSLRTAVDAVQRLALAYGEDLDTIEVNPMLLLRDRPVALDAKLRLRGA